MNIQRIGETTMEQKKTSPKGLFFLFTAAIIWGFAFVAQRLGADSVTPFLFNFSRYVLGATSLIPVILLFEKGAEDPAVKKTTLRVGIVAGILLFTASYLHLVIDRLQCLPTFGHGRRPGKHRCRLSFAKCYRND